MTIKTYSTMMALMLASFEAVSAAPLEPRQAPCYPQNMPVGVSQYNCPKKQYPDAQGTCTAFLDSHSSYQCSGYCEARVTMLYGQEVPFGIGNCQANEQCTLSSGSSVTVTTEFSINLNIGGGVSSMMERDVSAANYSTTGLERREDGKAPGLEASFSFGASWSWSTSVGYTQANQQQFQLGNNCGYWTFVPFLIESCGDLTTSPVDNNNWVPTSNSVLGLEPGCLPDQAVTTPNWCNTVPSTDDQGHAIGKTILVLTDCNTNKILPMDQQDPVYRYPGVSTAQQ